METLRPTVEIRSLGGFVVADAVAVGKDRHDGHPNGKYRIRDMMTPDQAIEFAHALIEAAEEARHHARLTDRNAA